MFEFWFTLYTVYAIIKKLYINTKIHNYLQLTPARDSISIIALVKYRASNSLQV